MMRQAMQKRMVYQSVGLYMYYLTFCVEAYMQRHIKAVSYTHLTLPTNREV